MQIGAVALLDALGFKGIWSRHPGGADGVLMKMKNFRDRALQLGSTSPNQNKITRARVEIISDSIAIGVVVDPNIGPPEDQGHLPLTYDALAVAAVGSLAAGACGIALQEAPALAYRGCIAFGEFDMSEGFIIGPAVDEAAERMEQAEGAFVWCAKSAYEPMRDWTRRFPDFRPPNFIPYGVPLKTGIMDTFALVPWHPWATWDMIAKENEALLGTFDARGRGIAMKRRNTAAFLEAAAKMWTPRAPK